MGKPPSTDGYNLRRGDGEESKGKLPVEKSFMRTIVMK